MDGACKVHVHLFICAKMHCTAVARPCNKGQAAQFVVPKMGVLG